MASARNRADTTLLLAQDGCLGWVLHAPICSSKHASIGLLTLYSRINKQHSGIRQTAEGEFALETDPPRPFLWFGQRIQKFHVFFTCMPSPMRTCV